MNMAGIGYNGSYVNQTGKSAENAGTAGRNGVSTSEGGVHTDFSLKYVQAGGGNKVLLDPEALFSTYHVASGESLNIYRADGFSEENPIYIVKGTDRNGNEYEERVDVSKVNPNHCSYKEMAVLGIHTGKRSDDLFFSMSILKDKAANSSYSEKEDYLTLLSELRGDMKKCGRWDSYMRYDKIIGDILSYRKTISDESKGKKDSDDTQEEKTDSEVIVRPDGSRVLMVTTHIGGAETVTSVKISEPSEFAQTNNYVEELMQKTKP